MDKKKRQLGMNPSTASHRLIKDIMWDLIQKTNQDTCCKCDEIMTRENFSIEHVIPWLDSEDPIGLFFDLNNIRFSHLSCNVGARRQTNVAKCGTFSKYTLGCRCVECTIAKAEYGRNNYCPDSRRNRYLRTGN